MNFYEKISQLQVNLKAPKSKFNSFGNYKYRSTEDIYEGVKPLLNEFGLVLTVTDMIVNIGGKHYIKATATLTDGEFKISTDAYAREEDSHKGMNAPQITGSASSYSRKYALNGLLCVDDTQDADTLNNSQQDYNPDAVVEVTPRRSRRKVTTEDDPLVEYDSENIPF